jgi:CRP/FNR family transcriptional regulator
MQSKVFYLKQFPIFDGLSDGQIEELAQFLEEKEVGKMQIVFDPEDQDKVFFIKKGMVEVYHITEDGKKTIIDTLGPKSFFAAVGFGKGSSHFLEATEDTLICVMTKDRLFEMVAEDPSLTRKIVDGLLDQLFVAREQLAILATGSVRDRLLHILGRLTSQYGVQLGGKVKIKNRFTHEDLASMIGASRETVTKMLALLEKDGIIEREGKYLIVDPNTLKKKV